MSFRVLAANSPILHVLGMQHPRVASEASDVLRQRLDDHGRIVETLPDRDPDDAQGAMIAQIRNGRRSILAAMDELRGARA